jgi:putative transcriptional regulator
MNERADILLEMLGQRLKQTRLNADRTQQEVADIIGMSRTAIEGAEKGKCNLSTFVSILLALDATDQLDLFLPEPPPSPVLLAKAKGLKRQRASAAKALQTSPQRDELEW